MFSNNDPENEEEEDEVIIKKQLTLKKQNTKYNRWSKKETETLSLGMDNFQGNWKKITTLVDGNKIA